METNTALCAGLVYAYLNFPDKLQDDTKAALERAFPEILKGIRGHKVRWQYTNIFFNLGGLVSLSRVLDDPSVHAEAVADFDMWLAGTAADGFHEFNSPTYTPVTLFGIEAAWAHTQDGTFRARLQRIMDVITYQMALNISSNGFLGGGAARAYQRDALHGTGGAALYAHIKFGAPCPPIDEGASITYANQTLFDYVPPEAARHLALEKPEYTEIHDRGVSVDWGGGDVRLISGQSVAISYGDLHLGVVPMLLDRAGGPARGNALLAYGEDGELRLQLRLYGGPDLRPEDHPLDALLFVEVGVPDATDTLAAFADHLAGWRLSQRTDGEAVSFSAAHPDGASIAYPFTEADPDPIGDALHVSPGLTLRPGDLVKLVNGEAPLPFSE